MSKDDRISIKKYYETLFRGEQKRWPSLDRMAWLIDQIVESKYGEIFFYRCRVLLRYSLFNYLMIGEI